MHSHEILSVPSGSMEKEQMRHPPCYVYFLASIACLNSIKFGYDIGCVGGAALLMRDDFGWSAVQTEWFIASANVFAIFGALFAPTLCDGVGRRHTFTISCIISAAGILLVILLPYYIPIMCGRAFTGLGIGLGLAIDPLYISEISPPAFRGRLVSFSELAINIGILLGMVADFAFLGLPSGLNWRLMMGLGLVLPGVLIAITTTIMPESPRWLIANDRTDEAMAVLRRTSSAGTDIDSVVHGIAENIQKDAAAAAQGWAPILRPTVAVRRMLLAGIGLSACQQINGSEAFIYFSPSLLEKASIESRTSRFACMVGIGLSKTIFIGVGAYLVDSWGRRPLLFLSTASMSMFLLIIAVSFPHPSLMPLTLFAMFAFVGAFSVGIGPVCWAGVAEVFPFHIRAKAMSLATSTNRLVSALVAGTTLSLSNALGVQGFFTFYAVLTMGSTLYLWYFFPETKGRSLEEMSAIFTGPRTLYNGDGNHETKCTGTHHIRLAAADADEVRDDDAPVSLEMAAPQTSQPDSAVMGVQGYPNLSQRISLPLRVTRDEGASIVQKKRLLALAATVDDLSMSMDAM